MKTLIIKRYKAVTLVLVMLFPFLVHGQIDRQALVQRHIVKVNRLDPLSSLSVGNGKFAFTVDVTGLQTFPEAYDKGVPLGTQSEWGWDTFKDTAGYKIEESYRDVEQFGRKVPYSVQVNTSKRSKDAVDWYRQNVHRLQLGSVGLELRSSKGNLAKAGDLKNIRQQLDPWTGLISSSFTFEGTLVEVLTVAHQHDDLISAQIKSPLIAQGRLKVRLRFSYPTGTWSDSGDNWKNPEKHHSSIVSKSDKQAVIKHQLDSAAYFTSFSWQQGGAISSRSVHHFTISPDRKSGTFAFTCLFSQEQSKTTLPLFSEVQENSVQEWKAFWLGGAAVDFSDCTDSRAKELERRIILSQYLTKIQCSGNFPPQETGLTYNSWFGKPHLEMHWWHSFHFALWGRPEILSKSTNWYFKVKGNAAKIAARQGFGGVRWQKMTDHNGNESPSSVGAMLIWQQPHLITFTELLYRAHPDKDTLEKYKDLVFATADFMASFAQYNNRTKHYVLGPGLIPAQERFKAAETFNPTYELAYWEWGLRTAQEWRNRLGLAADKKWADVLSNLSSLPKQNGVYLATESATDSYTNPEYKTDHPSVLGTYGMLPETSLLDTAVMKKTFRLVWDTWTWSDTWGWDFPMTAMAAARLGMPERAVDALMMNIRTNTYLASGHNYQDDRLRIYLPGNGGLLTAVAMMCAGWDGNTAETPGFPKDGKWKVKWEGLKKMM